MNRDNRLVKTMLHDTPSPCMYSRTGSAKCRWCNTSNHNTPFTYCSAPPFNHKALSGRLCDRSRPLVVLCCPWIDRVQTSLAAPEQYHHDNIFARPHHHQLNFRRPSGWTRQSLNVLDGLELHPFPSLCYRFSSLCCPYQRADSKSQKISPDSDDRFVYTPNLQQRIHIPRAFC